jgi:hypothetical protein
MWHAIWTQGNRVDSRLLMVGSQTTNLTPSLSFGHNLCLKCPNGFCEPILDIFVSITFQWYKELFNPMGSDPYNRSLKIQESTGTPTPQSGSSLGSVMVHSLTLSCTPGNIRCASQASFLSCTFASPCFSREPKARVVTICMWINGNKKNMISWRFQGLECKQWVVVIMSIK